MGRSFSNARLIVSSVAESISKRGFSAASASASQHVGVLNKSMILKKGVEDAAAKSSSSWIPDPVTGYYRPDTDVKEEMDAAELRKMLLKHKN